MKQFLLLCILFGVVTASNSQIKSDYDKNTNFDAFKSYRIVGWEKDSDKILTPFDKERILNSLNAEMANRGIAKVSSNADIDITLYQVHSEL